jgi:hypothetical protein
MQLYLLITYPKKIVVFSNRFNLELTLVHEMTHAHHNRNVIRMLIHFLLDLAVLPTFASLMEGFALWTTDKYCRSGNQQIMFDLDYPLRYRMGYRLVKVIEKLFGRSTVIFMIKYL